MSKLPPTAVVALTFLLGACTAGAQTAAARREAPATISIRADAPGDGINPAMWGVFFEDINFGADGGLYAELVKNRSFEFPEPLMGWTVLRRKGSVGTCEILTASPASAPNPHYAQLRVEQTGDGFGLANEGFRGIGVRNGACYEFSAKARSAAGGPFALRIELTSRDGSVLAQAKVENLAAEWKECTAVLRAAATDARAHLNVFVEGRGTLDLDMISLFPRDTWKGRPRGLRADLVQMLADLKPGFVRFPGGCIVEGFHLATRYQWKKTLGDPSERPCIINRWNNEFAHRPAPDYFQSFGLGFYEYFLLCEDIGAEPLPILSCGMACQFNSGELAPLAELEPYIQDALDLIEFANGPATSAWGRTRAELGHPEPFKMTMLGIGNEQWGPAYIERYECFAKALREKHPEIKLVSSAGPDPDGEKFDFLWPRLRALGADIVDEHYYRPPAWFLDNARRYDAYDRNGPKVFAGEYAAQSVRTCSPENRNNWECALAEAAFMTGLERNAAVVRMVSYAPLFAHEEGWQWRPDLIWCDNLGVYGTPNYYVQQLFSCNRGDAALPVACANVPARLYATAARDNAAGQIILKVVNATEEACEARIELAGASATGAEGAATVLAAAPADENSLADPRKIVPVTTPLRAEGPTFSYTFAPRSVTVLRVPMRR